MQKIVDKQVLESTHQEALICIKSLCKVIRKEVSQKQYNLTYICTFCKCVLVDLAARPFQKFVSCFINTYVLISFLPQQECAHIAHSMPPSNFVVNLSQYSWPWASCILYTITNLKLASFQVNSLSIICINSPHIFQYSQHSIMNKWLIFATGTIV